MSKIQEKQGKTIKGQQILSLCCLKSRLRDVGQILYPGAAFYHKETQETFYNLRKLTQTKQRKHGQSRKAR